MDKRDSRRELKRHCSLKIGGYAEDLVTPIDEEELIEVYRKSKADGRKHCVIGKGSNVLFMDDGYEGLVIKNTRACSELALIDGRFGFLRNRMRLHVGASVPNQKLIKFCIDQNIEAPAYLQSVPGNIGGALFMNAGTGTKEGFYFSDFVRRVRVHDGKKAFYMDRNDCDFGYRKSAFMGADLLILGCEIECRIKKGYLTRRDAEARIKFAKDTQDDSFPNAGSVFNRGFRDIKSIRLMREGGARFSEKTCNWIINENNASSGDVLRLIARAESEHRAEGLDRPEIEWVILR